jgi:hypothetical protein
LNYEEFLRQENIRNEFESRFKQQKEYFHSWYSNEGFSKEVSEILSIKSAMLITDDYFTEIYNRKNKRLP